MLPLCDEAAGSFGRFGFRIGAVRFAFCERRPWGFANFWMIFLHLWPIEEGLVGDYCFEFFQDSVFDNSKKSHFWGPGMFEKIF